MPSKNEMPINLLKIMWKRDIIKGCGGDKRKYTFYFLYLSPIRILVYLLPSVISIHAFHKVENLLKRSGKLMGKRTRNATF
jgi:hypothetical protein